MFFVRQLQITNSLLSLIIISYICDLNRSCNATIVTTSSPWSNQLELRRTPKFFKENCTCLTQWQCECCAKINNDLLNAHHKLCADWTIFSSSWNIKANVRLNENIFYTNTFSAWNIPPFCAPIWPAIALTGCVHIHSIVQHEINTLHGCANVTVNFIAFNIVNFQIGCMDVGTGGIQFVEPNHHVASAISTEKPPEIELETNDIIKHTTTPLNSTESDRG